MTNSERPGVMVYNLVKFFLDEDVTVSWLNIYVTELCDARDMKRILYSPKCDFTMDEGNTKTHRLSSA